MSQLKERELSFVGKVLVLKAEVIASLAFLATTLPIPHKRLASLRNAMFRFLWGGQRERLRREVGRLPENLCQIAWVNVNNKRLLNTHKDLAWQAILECLPTRAFLKARECTRSAQCPRMRCGGDETVRHLFWECPFAMKVGCLLRHRLKELWDFER